jgi:RNA polymerase sigma-70 factor (ECF subfamily)
LDARDRFDAQVRPLLAELTFAARAFAAQEADAMDLLQETLARAFRRFDRFEPGTNLRAWLVTIMRHAAIDRARRRRIEPISFEDEPPEASAQTPAPAVPWEQLLSDELVEALRSLRPRHRLLLFLADVEGMSYREIAETLGIPIGTVMSGLHGARLKLRAQVLRRRRARE